MSVLAVGPALDLDGPLPIAPRYSLLSVPGVIVADGEDGRWLNGVNVYGYPEETPESWEPCSAGTFRVKTDVSIQSLPRFDSFGLYQPITCSSLNFGSRWQEFAERAERTLLANRSWGFERALSQGVPQSTNPFLGDANLVDVGIAATSTPEVALSLLEEAIGATGRQGLIHATPAVVAAWGFEKLETGDGLYTANGTPVAVGGGYSGADPVADDTPAAGQSWVFATGPVEVRISEMRIVDENINGSLDTSNNDVTFRAEIFALAVWDTALQAGVLVDWSP